MKKIVAVLMCMIMVFSLAGCGKGKDKVVVYASCEDYRIEDLRKQLKEKFPDIDVVVEYYSTGNATAKLKAEGDKTEADIVIGLETASMQQIAPMMADLSGFKMDHYLEGANDDDNRYIIFEKYEGAVIVNTKTLQEKGLAEPASYDDLLKPEYKGQIAMPNPKTSGTGYMFLYTWADTMGEKQAFDYVDKLQVNIKNFTESGSGPMKMLAQGDVAIGLGMIFQAATQITEGVPLKVLQFKEGCPYNTTAMGIVKGRETNENVKTIFNFLNEDFAYYDKAIYSPGKILKDQEVKIENYPAEVKSADMSSITDEELKQRLIGQWKY
ncbi:MAG: extracellular solute-binding protein [Eubacteriales bacterium]|nr:extracellular solute-binding protein [Eubacteriales bacterium]